MALIKILDDLGRTVTLAQPPRRIVSLVPSDTYSLFALGCGDRVVGRTEYCVEPAAAASIATIGGTKNVDVDAVMALQPDLVIGNQEENSRPVLEALAARTKVLVSLPRRVDEGLAHLARLAKALGVLRDPVVVQLMQRGYRARAQAVAAMSGARAFAPVWNDPWMTFNGDTYGSDMLQLAGVENAFGDRERLYPLAADLGKGPAIEATGRDVRYPRVSLDEVIARAPTMIVLSDEPCDFSAADEMALRAACPHARVLRVSGKDLFWHGAWSIDALPRLREQVSATI